METKNVLTLLPPRARQAIYVVYGLAGLAGLATVAFYGALPGASVPAWLSAGLAALGALSAPIGVLAASNTAPSEPPIDYELEPDDDGQDQLPVG